MHHPHLAPLKHRRRRVLQLALAGALPAWLAACQKPPAPREKLRIGEAGTPAMVLLYIAQEQKFFEQQGLDVDLRRYPSGRDAIAAVLAGEADVATPYDGPAVMNINRGQPIRILASLALTPSETAVLARADRHIRTPADLRGKRIGIIANSNPEYLLSVLLKDAGLRMSDVERVPLSPDATAQALVAGQVDAIASWTPHWQTAREQLGADATVTFTSPMYVETATLSTSSAILEQRAAALERMLRALLQAENFYRTQREAAFAIAQKALGEKFSAATLQERWASTIPILRLDHRLYTSLDNQAQWFAEHAGIGTAPEQLRSYMATELLRKVQPQAVTLPVAP